MSLIHSSAGGGSSSSAPLYGRALIDRDFQHHAPGVLRLNNGSFGACPRPVLAVCDALRAEWMAQPDAFYMKRLAPGMEAARLAVAQQVARCNSDDVVVLDNLTTASSIVCGHWLADDIRAHHHHAIKRRSVVAYTSDTGCDSNGTVTATGTGNPCCTSTTDSTTAALAQTTATAVSTSRVITEYIVLVTSLCYGSVRNAISHAQAKLKTDGLTLRVECVDITFPVRKSADLVTAFRNALVKLKADASVSSNALRLAVFDHISSVPAIVFPVREIIPLLRAAGFARIFIDGAHAPGNILELDVPSLGADFYAANLHKWLLTPTSAAFLWTRPAEMTTARAAAAVAPGSASPVSAASVKESSSVSGKDITATNCAINSRPASSIVEFTPALHHPVISHNYGVPAGARATEDGLNGGLGAEARMLGTRDYAAMLSVPAALAYYQTEMGGQQAIRRNIAEAWAAAEMLAAAWKTRIGTPPECACSMVMVALPKAFGNTRKDGQDMRTRLAATAHARDFTGGIVTQFCYPADDCLWLRLSMACYNERADYEVLRDAVLSELATISNSS